jgi:hypothetical protein
MTHGGKRAGAGRKVGTQTKRTRAIAEAVGATGVTPLEVLVNSMRIAWERSEQAGHEGEHFAMAVTCAEKAAPYMHAKYAAVQHSGSVDGNLTVVIRRFTDSEPA